MSDMSATKQLTGDMLPPSSQHTEVPLGTSTDDTTTSNNNNL
jgi:hypothetical protein